MQIRKMTTERVLTIAILTIVILVLMIHANPTDVYANDLTEYTFGETVTKSNFSDSDYEDWRQFTMTSSGVIKLDLSFVANPGTCRGVRLTVYNMNDEAVGGIDQGQNTSDFSESTYVGLLRGKYKICLSGYTALLVASGSASYKATVVDAEKNFQSYEESYDNSGNIQNQNNTLETADEITTGQSYHGLLLPKNSIDCYKFTVGDGGADISISGNYYNYDYWASAAIYNSNKQLIAYMSTANIVEAIDYTKTLMKGMYYLQVEGSWVDSTFSYAINITPRYRVIYDGNGSTGGTAPNSAVGYHVGEKVIVLGNTDSLTKSGYRFLGWSDNKNDTEAKYVAGDELTISDSDVVLYAVWEDLINLLSYDFNNFNEIMPKEICQAMYGGWNHFANTIYKNYLEQSAKDDQGNMIGVANCYGIAATSSLLYYDGNGINTQDFRTTAKYPKNLDIADTNNNLFKIKEGKPLSLKEFIQCMMVAQSSWQANQITVTVSPQQLESFYNTIKDETEKGKPVLVNMDGVDNKDGGYGSWGHAVLAYGVRSVSNDEKEILIYDSNYKLTQRCITYSKKTNELTYELMGTGAHNGQLIFKNTDADSVLSYVVYDKYSQLWNLAGKLIEDKQIILKLNGDYSIKSMGGETIGSVKNGKLQTNNPDICQAGFRGISEQHESGNNDSLIYLPIGHYIIENDNNTSALDIEFANVKLGGMVKTQADKIEIYVDDKEKNVSVLFPNGTNESYEITLESIENDDQSRVICSGNCVKAGAFAQLQDDKYYSEKMEDATVITEGNIEKNENFCIVFDTQGGTAVENIENIENNATIELPNTTKEGFVFEGWFTEPNGQGTKYTDQTPITNSLTLYAYWLEKDPAASRSGMDPEAEVTANSELYLIKGQTYELGTGNWRIEGATKALNLTVKKGVSVITAKNASANAVNITNGIDTYRVYVTAPSLAFAGGKKTAKLVVGEFTELTIGGIPENMIDGYAIAWQSNKTEIATVDPSAGKSTTVKAVGKGSAKITAFVAGKAFTCTVTVTDDAKNVPKSIGNIGNVTLNPTQAVSLKYTSFDAKNAVWESLDSHVMTEVDPDKKGIMTAYSNGIVKIIKKTGKITAVGAGETSISGTDAAGRKVTLNIRVLPLETNSVAYVKCGKNVILKAPKLNKKYTQWNVVSGNEYVQSLDNGKVVAVTSLPTSPTTDHAVIRCIFKPYADGDGFDYYYNVYVQDPSLTTGDGLQSVKQNQYTLAINAGDTFSLSDHYTGISQGVVWKNSKPAFAYVDEYGVIHANKLNKAGATKLSTTINGTSISITVNVAAK